MSSSVLPSLSLPSSSSSLIYSTTQTDSLLVRSRDAIARLTNDLSVATSRISALENELNNLREQNTILKKDLSSLSVKESTTIRLYQDNQLHTQELETNYQNRLQTLENDLRMQRDATNAAIVASQGSQLTAQAYEEKYHQLTKSYTELTNKYQEKEQETYTHRRLIGELRDRLTTTLEERDEARHEIDRIHHELTLAKQETQSSDSSASTARNEARHASQRVHELEILVGKIESEAAVAREQAMNERTRCINLETNMKEALTRWLMSIRTKFAGIPLQILQNNNNGIITNTEIPLPPSPLLDGSIHPPSDDKILAWLEALPDVAAWFQRASISLTNQIESRLQLASVAVDRLATRLINHDNTEHRLCVNAQALADQRGQEIDNLHKEILQYQNDITQLKLINATLIEDNTKYKKLMEEAMDRGELAEQTAIQSRDMLNEATLAADEAIASKLDVESAMKRLQAAWEERDRALRNEITSLENEFSAAERAWANELSETRDRLATVTKRLKHTKQFVIPQAVKTSLSSEIDRSGALVRDAQAVVRACRAHSERILNYLRSSGHGIQQANEPSWMSQVRASMAAETSAAASFAEATENLARIVQQYVALGVNSTMQDSISALGGDTVNPPVSQHHHHHTHSNERLVSASNSYEDAVPSVMTTVPSKNIPFASSVANVPRATSSIPPIPSMSNAYNHIVNNTNHNVHHHQANSNSHSTNNPLSMTNISSFYPDNNNNGNYITDYRSSIINNGKDVTTVQSNNNDSLTNVLSSNGPSNITTNNHHRNPTTNHHRALQSGMVEYVQELTHSTINNQTSSQSSTTDNIMHNHSYPPIEEVDSPKQIVSLLQPYSTSVPTIVPSTTTTTTPGEGLPASMTTQVNYPSIPSSVPLSSIPSAVPISTTTTTTANNTINITSVPVQGEDIINNQPNKNTNTATIPSNTNTFPSNSSVSSQPLSTITSPSVTLTNQEDNEWKLRRQKQQQTHNLMNNRLKALGLDASNTSINGIPFQPLPISGALGGGVSFVGLQSSVVQPKA